MSKLTQISCFLNELNSKSSKDAISLLKTITEELEDKNDPEPIEIEIVSNSYQLMEKLNLLMNLLQRYSISKQELPGSILNNLYNRND